METRKIKINNIWYSVGDTIHLKENLNFFWKLPITINKKYEISFIGNDSCAQIKKNGRIKTIIGEVLCQELETKQ